MARRLTVGIPFTYQEDWLGGVYYVRNLVCALALLSEEDRPSLVVIGEDPESAAYLRSETGFPDIGHVAPAAIRRIPRWRRGFGLREAGLGETAPAGGELDLVLLGPAPGLEARTIQWIPDFQEERFPHFFSAAELAARRRRNGRWLKRHRHVMVSSEDVRGDLLRYYPAARSEVHVIPFASFVRRPGPAELASLREKYALPERYFICTNQFWRHKNHGVVLSALAELRGDAADPPVVFTGKEHDYRDPAYAPSLRALAGELGLGDRARFLGMLPRTDQLGLTAGAIAVVQPSLCEGWSTVVEDAKAMERHLLVSDIAVHREQLDTGADFFAPDDRAALAHLLRRYGGADPPPPRRDYAREQSRFSERLLRLLTEVERDLRVRRAPRLVIDGRPEST